MPWVEERPSKNQGFFFLVKKLKNFIKKENFPFHAKQRSAGEYLFKVSNGRICILVRNK